MKLPVVFRGFVYGKRIAWIDPKFFVWKRHEMNLVLQINKTYKKSVGKRGTHVLNINFRWTVFPVQKLHPKADFKWVLQVQISPQDGLFQTWIVTN